MCIRRLLPLLVLTSFALPGATADVRAILENRITQTKKATGMVVGTIDASGKREVLAAGAGLNGDSVLEIGSITLPCWICHSRFRVCPGCRII